MDIMSAITKALLVLLFVINACIMVIGVFLLPKDPWAIFILFIISLLAVMLGKISWEFKINGEKNRMYTFFIGGMTCMLYAINFSTDLHYFTFFGLSSIWFGIEIFRNR